MKTMQRHSIFAGILAFALLASSCSLGLLQSGIQKSGATKANVTFSIPLINTHLIPSSAVARGLGTTNSRAFVVASYAEILISDQFGNVVTSISINNSLIDPGSGSVSYATSVALGDGNYTANVKVYNYNNPNTYEPTVVGTKAFTVQGVGAQSVTVTCLPYNPIAVAEGDGNAAWVDLSSPFVFDSGNNPVSPGSEAWYAITPTSDATTITAYNNFSSNSTSFPLILLFDSTGKYLALATCTDGSGTTSLNFPSVAYQTYYVAVSRMIIQGNSDAVSPSFYLKYNPHGLNSAPTAPTPYSPGSGAQFYSTYYWQNFMWQASTDVNLDPISYEIIVATGNSTDANGKLLGSNPGYTVSYLQNPSGLYLSADVWIGHGGYTYYWQIVARDGFSESPSAIGWFYTYNNAPNPVALNTPYNYEVNISPNNAYFSWSASYDADSGDALTYNLWISADSGATWNNYYSGQITSTTVNIPPNSNLQWYIESNDGLVSSTSSVWNVTTSNGTSPVHFNIW